MLVGWDIEGY
uniref:Uncharacterized protein n=1 Tax=Lepeophtheirus salmonis TaxID=72036 RepID=A0A0K2TZ41_LEPSM